MAKEDVYYMWVTSGNNTVQMGTVINCFEEDCVNNMHGFCGKKEIAMYRPEGKMSHLLDVLCHDKHFKKEEKNG